MSRLPSHDEQGRPIVAELGRAETPDEIAERKAAASRKHRVNQTALNLVLALGASLGIVLLLVLVVVRPDSAPRASIDYAQIGATAQGAVDEPLVIPVLPEGWGANRAELEAAPADGVPAWRIGFITPATQYIALDQGIDANPSWVADHVVKARSDATVQIGGLDWQVYDRRDVDDPGNVAYALVTESGASTVVLSGTATDAEFMILAESVAKELTP